MTDYAVSKPASDRLYRGFARQLRYDVRDTPYVRCVTPDRSTGSSNVIIGIVQDDTAAARQRLKNRRPDPVRVTPRYDKLGKLPCPVSPLGTEYTLVDAGPFRAKHTTLQVQVKCSCGFIGFHNRTSWITGFPERVVRCIHCTRKLGRRRRGSAHIGQWGGI